MPVPLRISGISRTVLLSVVVAIAATDTAVAFRAPGATDLRELASLLLLPPTVIFVWRPVAASILLVLTAGGLLAIPGDLTAVFFLATAAGLVGYSNPAWSFRLYLVCSTLLVGAAAVTGADFHVSSVVALIITTVVSSALGLQLRTARWRSEEYDHDRRRFERTLSERLTAERERLVGELHDTIARDVSLISLHARALETSRTDADRLLSLKTIQRHADKAISDTQRLLRQEPNSSNTAPLAPAADARVQHFAPTGVDKITDVFRDATTTLTNLGARVTTLCSLNGTLPPTTHSVVCQALREGCANIAKHAGSEPEVRIELTTQPAAVTVVLQNSLNPAAPRRGALSTNRGLTQLRDRVTALDGELSTTSRADAFHLRIELPLG